MDVLVSECSDSKPCNGWTWLALSDYKLWKKFFRER